MVWQEERSSASAAPAAGEAAGEGMNFFTPQLSMRDVETHLRELFTNQEECNRQLQVLEKAHEHAALRIDAALKQAKAQVDQLITTTGKQVREEYAAAVQSCRDAHGLAERAKTRHSEIVKVQQQTTAALEATKAARQSYEKRVAELDSLFSKVEQLPEIKDTDDLQKLDVLDTWWVGKQEPVDRAFVQKSRELVRALTIPDVLKRQLEAALDEVVLKAPPTTFLKVVYAARLATRYAGVEVPVRKKSVQQEKTPTHSTGQEEQEEDVESSAEDDVDVEALGNNLEDT